MGSHVRTSQLTADSAHAALIVVQHERSLNLVCEREYLLLTEQSFEQRKDPLARCRIGTDGEDNAGSGRNQRTGEMC